MVAMVPVPVTFTLFPCKHTHIHSIKIHLVMQSDSILKRAEQQQHLNAALTVLLSFPFVCMEVITSAVMTI